MSKSVPTQRKRRDSGTVLLVLVLANVVGAVVEGPALGHYAKGTYLLVLAFFIAWIDSLPEGRSS